MEKYLIINADDFGMAPSVNCAIIELYNLGLVTNTSLMVNMPGFPDASRRLINIRGLGIGLHFNLSAGSPVAPAHWVPSLVDDRGELSEDLDWRERDVMIELKAQMNRLLSAGIHPAHIDSHRFIQNRAVVCRSMIALARSMMLPMRLTGSEPDTGMYMPQGVTNFIASTYFNENGKNLLLDNLRSIPPGTSELICHPGYTDDILEEVCTWTRVREIELSVLKDPDIREAIRELNIRLINYNHLKNPFNLQRRHWHISLN